MFYTSSRLRQQHGDWYGVLSYKDGSAHRERSKKLSAKTRRDALVELAEWWQDMEDSATRRGGTSKVLDYVLEIVDGMEARHVIEPSTAGHYRKDAEAWRPWLGDVRLCDLTRDMIEGGMADMFAAGRSATTVNKRFTVLKMACSDAVMRGDLKRSPFVGIRRPKLQRTRKNSVDDDEMRQRVKDKLASLPLTRYVVAFYLALYVGLRRGEICGLEVQDIDFRTNRGWVRRSVGVTSTGTYVKEAKTGRVRDFPLPDTLRDVLSRWVDQQEREWAALGMRLKPTDWLLGYPDGHHMSIDVLSRKWASLAENEGWVGAAGKRPTLHDLRHTFATEAIAAGIDVKTVSSILGHANAAMTLDVYATPDPEAKRRAARVLEEVI